MPTVPQRARDRGAQAYAKAIEPLV